MSQVDPGIPTVQTRSQPPERRHPEANTVSPCHNTTIFDPFSASRELHHFLDRYPNLRPRLSHITDTRPPQAAYRGRRCADGSRPQSRVGLRPQQSAADPVPAQRSQQGGSMRCRDHGVTISQPKLFCDSATTPDQKNTAPTPQTRPGRPEFLQS